MNTLMITKNAQFHDPSQEVISGAGIGVVWYNNYDALAIGQVISPFEWSLTGNSGMRGYFLRDSKGEVRPIYWGTYPQAIEYPTWEKYDSFKMKEEIQRLKDELGRAYEIVERFGVKSESLEDEVNALRNTLAHVFDVNEAGRGSRKRVRELIMEQGIFSCENCGKASCLCHEDYDD